MKKLTLTCTVTGKAVTYTSEEYIQKRIDRAGSLEKLMAAYVSRDAGKVLKKSKPVIKQTDKTFNGQRILDTKVTAVPSDSKRVELHDGKYVFYSGKTKTGEMISNSHIGAANK